MPPSHTPERRAHGAFCVRCFAFRPDGRGWNIKSCRVVKRQKITRLYIGTPAYNGTVHYAHVLQSMGLATRVDSAVSIVGLRYVESCSVSWARNTLLHSAKGKADWLLMVDSDTFHLRAEDIESMLSVDADVVAAPVAVRGRSGLYNVYREAGDQWSAIGEAHWRGAVVPVDAVGTAFMAIRLSWVRDHWPDQPWFEEIQLSGDTPSRVSSDLVFCRRVKQRGGRIMVDGRFEPIHLATPPLSMISGD